MRVLLYFEQNGSRASKTVTFPEGLSPTIGMVIQDDCDHDFKIREITLQLDTKPRRVIVELDYVPYGGGREADVDIMATFGWKVSKKD